MCLQRKPARGMGRFVKSRLIRLIQMTNVPKINIPKAIWYLKITHGVIQKVVVKVLVFHARVSTMHRLKHLNWSQCLSIIVILFL